MVRDVVQLLSTLDTTLQLVLRVVVSILASAHGRWQEHLANRDNLTTSLLCASSQVTKTFVLTFKCGLARTLLRTGAC